MDDPKHGAYSRYESLGQASHPVSGDTMLLGDPLMPQGRCCAGKVEDFGANWRIQIFLDQKRILNYKHIFIVWFTPYAN